METLVNKKVGQLVAEDYRTAAVFSKYGIDFCCGGGITIEKACIENKVDQNILEKELLQLNVVDNEVVAYDKWELDVLIDHIINVHHTYVKENVAIISEYANKVARVHGHHYTEVIEVNKLFNEVANELVSHLQKEEQVLFPYIKKLVAAEKGSLYNSPPFGTVNNPIRMMEHEHEGAGAIFKEISRVTNNYTPPQEACTTFKVLYAKLEEFEKDLHKHIHLENNILHVKAIALEKVMVD
ncbi:iron-sulfur cluster repair di-iron protein [Aquimarina sp. I32.4]|uniref:iron-sulfur cluster repair di-iron protein n=1 Tax=Aquimarina sp. I32.4 TaxID=2053903 RepID=UPI000CDE71E2|nr:iron-sulfur cluster repair di-iron protein [Aquimarina sp. I32.4]